MPQPQHRKETINDAHRLGWQSYWAGHPDTPPRRYGKAHAFAWKRGWEEAMDEDLAAQDELTIEEMMS